MKIGIRHQESYSRGQLLLRFFFGGLYIALPHFFCLIFLMFGMAFVRLFAFFAILFTGKFPKGMFNYILGVQRWAMRVNARLANMSDGYPAFGLDVNDPDVVLDVIYPESSNRLTVLLRFLIGPIMVLPHLICLMLLGIPAAICGLLAFFAILFTGKYPKGLFDFVMGVNRWNTRVGMYLLFMTDTYPPFTMAETDPIDWNNTKSVEDHLVG